MITKRVVLVVLLVMLNSLCDSKHLIKWDGLTSHRMFEKAKRMSKVTPNSSYSGSWTPTVYCNKQKEIKESNLLWDKKFSPRNFVQQKQQQQQQHYYENDNDQ